MKKTMLILLLTLLGAEVSFGQLALGIKVGFNANKLTTNIDSIKDQFNGGFHVGIFSRIGKRVYLAPELQYTMNGAVFTGEGKLSTSKWKQKIRLGSVDVPVLVGVKIIHRDLLTWRIEAGPEASFLINKKIEEINNVKGPVEKSSISSVNWYLMAGTGVDVLFLKFDLRYQLGLNRVIENAGSYPFDSKNSLFVLSVGWKIFGKK